jgi:hypothetical protein
MSRAVGVLLLGVAVVLFGFGVYGFAKRDVQGGADAAGAFFVIVAFVAAFLGVALIRFRRGSAD